MGYYLPTLKAYEAGHKVARAAQYTLDLHGGLAYPDGAGGVIQVDAQTVDAWVADGWLASLPPPEDATAPRDERDHCAMRLRSQHADQAEEEEAV